LNLRLLLQDFWYLKYWLKYLKYWLKYLKHYHQFVLVHLLHQLIIYCHLWHWYRLHYHFHL